MSLNISLHWRSKRHGNIKPMSAVTRRNIENALKVPIVVNPNVSQKPMRPYAENYARRQRQRPIEPSDKFSEIEFAGYPVKITKEWLSYTQYQDEISILDVAAFIIMRDFPQYRHTMVDEIATNVVAQAFMIDYVQSFRKAQNTISACSTPSNRQEIRRRTASSDKQSLLLLFDEYVLHLFDDKKKELKKHKSIVGIAFLLKFRRKLFLPQMIMDSVSEQYAKTYKLKRIESMASSTFTLKQSYLLKKKIITSENVLFTDPNSAAKTVICFEKQSNISLTYNKRNEEIYLDHFYVKTRHALSSK